MRHSFQRHPQRKAAPCPAPSGFTLIELLVVMLIVAVLAGLLVPVLANAKASARKTACLNNLRQIGLGAFVYAEDQNGHLPYFRNWLYTKPGDLKSGRMFAYLKSKDVYLCPTDKIALTSKRQPTAAGSPNFGNTRHPRDYSYAMNCCICHTTDLSLFLSPTRTMLYMEGELGADDYSGQVGPSLASHTLAFRHNRRGHLLMADLHVDSLDKKRYDPLSKTKRFWFPTTDTKGFNGMQLGGDLK